MAHIHVIGGGLAGLSAAVEMAGRIQVTLYEASPSFGGRVRSFDDALLHRHIDNGNHLLLSGNRSVMRYLGLIGALSTLRGPGRALYPWFDLREKKHWTLSLSMGRFPWWLFSRRKSVPGMRLRELRDILKILCASDTEHVAECLGGGALTQRLLEPFAISTLNTCTHEASAHLLANVMRQSLMRGGRACCPLIPQEGLSQTFVEPAIEHLSRMRMQLSPQMRLTGLEGNATHVTHLQFGAKRVAVHPGDAVVLAVTAPVAENLLQQHFTQFVAPNAFESILNLHFVLPSSVKLCGNIEKAGFVGLIHGISEWIYVKGGVVSVTVSAANRYSSMEQDGLTKTVWDEVKAALDQQTEVPLPGTIPPVRVLREKRATFAATPEQNARRPQVRTPWQNLVLAGDWTATGLPSTMEGAVRSGRDAACALGFAAPLHA